MPRPLNKGQLLASIQKEYGRLDIFLSTLTSEQITYSPASGIWSIKDILAHLYEWQQMFFTWYETGLRGEIPQVPAPGYKWSQLPALNAAVYEKYRNLLLNEVLTMFRVSHRKTVELIEAIPDDDLIKPGLYAWMNQNNLMAYLNANTAAHYAWALKAAKKTLREEKTSKPGNLEGRGKPVETRGVLLARLDETVTRLLNTYHDLSHPGLMITEEWSARDVLAHLTFWHENFARNLDNLAHGRKLQLLKGRLGDLNQAGVGSLRAESLEAMIVRIEAAQRMIRENILNPALIPIPYRQGSREYTPEEYTESVTAHINQHLKELHKILKNLEG